MAAKINEADVCRVVGDADRLVVAELVRTNASQREFEAAVAFACGPLSLSAAAYRSLAGRTQRLVDLLAIVLPRPQHADGRSPPQPARQ